MRLPPLPLPHGPSPPRAARRRSALIVLGIVGLVLSCSSDGPFEPPAQSDLPIEAAAAKRGAGVNLIEGALSVEDMLGDPLFQELVQAIDQPSLAEPLLAVWDALASGQTQRAKNLIAEVGARAVALEDDPSAAEALMYWSAVERYLEEAELI